jgi:hypothetical protein
MKEPFLLICGICIAFQLLGIYQDSDFRFGESFEAALQRRADEENRQDRERILQLAELHGIPEDLLYRMPGDETN